MKEKEIIELDNLYGRDYPEDVKNSMYRYSENGGIVNNCLRNHNGVWNSELKEKYGLTADQFNSMVKDLDNNQVKLVKDTTIYRGLKADINDFKLEMKIRDKGYASTSFDKGVSRYFATNKGVILNIDVFKGIKGVYIRQNSQRPGEIEFLLPRNTELVVYDIKGSNVHCKLNYI